MMKPLHTIITRVRYKKWTLRIAFAYFLKNVARELNIAPTFFRDNYSRAFCKKLRKFLRKNDKGELYFDINGALLPDFSSNKEHVFAFTGIFEDTFWIPLYYNDNYDKTIVESLDQYMAEGPYGYKDRQFDVTIQKDDVVIDAGAWIGDFSAYAASKGAISYAFEPMDDNYRMLCKTAELNGNIYPVKKGLGDCVGELDIFDGENIGASSLVVKNNDQTLLKKKIMVTTLDKFVEENKIVRVDFIKADIEGAERLLLKGATQVLKKYAPKIAICTYHFPDDPEVLERLILEANPAYKVVHLRHKLFAAVVD